MIESTTLADAASETTPSGKMVGVRRLLIAVAVIELVEALLDLPVLFGRASILFGGPSELAASGFDETIAKARIAVHPLLALAALTFAATDRIRPAIVALGAIVVVLWLSFMPSVARSGLRLDDGFDIQWTTAQIFAFPLMTSFATVLAARNERLALATTLVSIPALYNIVGMAGFTILVIINGF